MSAEKETERAYIEGARMAWRRLLGEALGELSVFEPRPEHPNVTIARLMAEREDMRAALRRACEEFGDNDWSDDLHLADVLEKHLLSYIEETS